MTTPASARPKLHILMQCHYTTQDSPPKDDDWLQGNPNRFFFTKAAATQHVDRIRAEAERHSVVQTVSGGGAQGTVSAGFSYWDLELEVGLAYWVEADVEGDEGVEEGDVRAFARGFLGDGGDVGRDEGGC